MKYKIIVEKLKEYILKNTLLPGDKLPGGRKLADILNISKTTVYEALELLQDEGIVDIREKSGTYLSAMAWEIILSKKPNWQKYIKSGWQKPFDGSMKNLYKYSDNDVQINLTFSALHKDFEFNTVLSEVLTILADEIAWTNRQIVHNNSGLLSLRKQLQTYLAKKGVNTSTEHILVMPSNEAALDVIFRSLVNASNVIYIPESTFSLYTVGVASIGANITPVPEDNKGLSVEFLKSAAAIRIRSL